MFLVAFVSVSSSYMYLDMMVENMLSSKHHAFNCLSTLKGNNDVGKN